tara:strand:+ start:144 stop:272 length:129 start_codon:yes stop_codon:yes gene_type:complete
MTLTDNIDWVDSGDEEYSIVEGHDEEHGEEDEYTHRRSLTFL